MKGELYIDGKYAGLVEHLQLEHDVKELYGAGGFPVRVAGGTSKINVRMAQDDSRIREWKPPQINIEIKAGGGGGGSGFATGEPISQAAIEKAIRNSYFGASAPAHNAADDVADFMRYAMSDLSLPQRTNCRCSTEPVKDINMKTTKLLDLLQTNYTTADVILGNASYTYKAHKSLNLQPGDEVVVDTPRGTKVAQVVGVDAQPIIDVNAPFEYKWIVCKVDRTAYNAQMEQDAEFLDSMDKVERLREAETLKNQYRAALPEGTAARLAFEDAVAKVQGAVKAEPAAE